MTSTSLTLEILEYEIWKPPSVGSHLVLTYHRLRKDALANFTVADFRIKIRNGDPFTSCKA